MKLFAVSDTHFEFYPSNVSWQAVVDAFPQADVLVLAGDIATGDLAVPVLRYACQRFEHVVYVTGNHEYYQYPKPKLDAELRQLGVELPNFHFLDRSVAHIEGHRFIGCTLWFRYEPLNVLSESYLNDFKFIPNFRDWVYRENERNVQFLQTEMNFGDILVTHHLPSHAAVPAHFRGAALNCFYVCDLEPVLLEATPKLAIHGHSHAFLDRHLGDTRLFRNPMDYYRRGYQPTFEPVVIDLDT